MFRFVRNPYSPGERPAQGGHGWLLVRLEPNPSTVALPEFLKVDITRQQDNREYFKIMEGPYVGQQASVSMQFVKGPCLLFGRIWCENDTYISRFSEHNEQIGPVIVRYQKVPAVSEPIGPTERTQVVIGREIGSAFSQIFGPLDIAHQFDLMTPGRYRVKIPDYEHVALGRGYLTTSPYATTWFPIAAPLTVDFPGTSYNEVGRSGRYFHMGRVSLGCMSLQPTAEWTAIARHVMKSRLDAQHVGYLEVLP